MFTLILLAALGSAPNSAPPVERWTPYPANPAWEMYGKEDLSGRFIWSQMRIRREPSPVVNYGVSLPEQSPSGHSLQTSYGANALGAELSRESLGEGLGGAVGSFGQALAGAIDASNPEAYAAGSEAEHLCSSDNEDCNGGRCPRLKPKPKPAPDELEGFVALVKSKQEVAFAIAAILLTFFVLGLFLVALLWGCRALFRLLFREKQPWEHS